MLVFENMTAGATRVVSIRCFALPHARTTKQIYNHSNTIPHNNISAHHATIHLHTTQQYTHLRTHTHTRTQQHTRAAPTTLYYSEEAKVQMADNKRASAD